MRRRVTCESCGHERVTRLPDGEWLCLACHAPSRADHPSRLSVPYEGQNECPECQGRDVIKLRKGWLSPYLMHTMECRDCHTMWRPECPWPKALLSAGLGLVICLPSLVLLGVFTSAWSGGDENAAIAVLLLGVLTAWSGWGAQKGLGALCGRTGQMAIVQAEQEKRGPVVPWLLKKRFGPILAVVGMLVTVVSLGLLIDSSMPSVHLAMVIAGIGLFLLGLVLGPWIPERSQDEEAAGEPDMMGVRHASPGTEVTADAVAERGRQEAVEDWRLDVTESVQRSEDRARLIAARIVASYRGRYAYGLRLPPSGPVFWASVIGLVFFAFCGVTMGVIRLVELLKSIWTPALAWVVFAAVGALACVVGWVVCLRLGLLFGKRGKPKLGELGTQARVSSPSEAKAVDPTAASRKADEAQRSLSQKPKKGYVEEQHDRRTRTMKETMEDTFTKVWDTASRWEHLGTRDLTKQKGIFMIGHIPEKGVLAYLHTRFNGLSNAHIKDLEERLATLRLALPEELAAFLRSSNGLKLFYNELVVFGSTCPSDELSKRFFHPPDLFDVNEVMPKGTPRSWLWIALYPVEEDRVYIDCDQDMSVVFKCKEGGYEPIKKWPSFEAWLVEETRRLAKLYTKEGERVIEKVKLKNVRFKPIEPVVPAQPQGHSEETGETPLKINGDAEEEKATQNANTAATKKTEVEPKARMEEEASATAALTAAERGYHKRLRSMAEEDPALLDATDTEGRTPAILATQKGRTKCLEVIAEVMPEALSIPRNDGRTPAFTAAQTGHVDCLRLLAEACPDSLRAAASDGTTPLFAAADHGYADCLAFLLEAVPDTISIPRKDGVTPAEAAAKAGHDKCARLIVERLPKGGLGKWASGLLKKLKRPPKRE